MIGEVCYYQEINIGKTQFEHLSPDSYAELLVVSVDGRNVVLSDGTVYQDWNYNRARFAVGDTVSRTRVETRGDGLCYHLVGRGADMWGFFHRQRKTELLSDHGFNPRRNRSSDPLERWIFMACHAAGKCRFRSCVAYVQLGNRSERHNFQSSWTEPR